MKVTKILPCGYCKGVANAIRRVSYEANIKGNEPLYCLNQIVHNDIVNHQLEELGVKILEGDKEQLINDIDRGIVVFSAHGTPAYLIEKAQKKNLKVINTICPWVQKVMDVTLTYLNQGFEIIYIGKKNHPEAIAECSLSPRVHLIESMEDLHALHIKSEKVMITNQTTMSCISLLHMYNQAKILFPNIVILDEICNATRIRQEAVKKICESGDIDGLIVVGDKKSNNSNNLSLIGKKMNVDTLLVDNYKKIPDNWLENKTHVGVASGTSTPIELVDSLVSFIKKKK